MHRQSQDLWSVLRSVLTHRDPTLSLVSRTIARRVQDSVWILLVASFCRFQPTRRRFTDVT
ncbi:hypothetical protein [Roseococcus sp.]|uniref:hypothetical protein n=1 Tax=Roseococcus sp. TaxID=2109646 RepID=UPI003BA9532C